MSLWYCRVSRLVCPIMSRSLLLLLAVVLSVVLGGVSSATCPPYITVDGSSFPGYDLFQVAASDASTCSAACCAVSNCQAFTFNIATADQHFSSECTVGSGCCWLKFQRGDALASSAAGNVTSGHLDPSLANAAVAVYDYEVSFALTADSELAVSDPDAFEALLLIDVSINLMSNFPQVSASVVLAYLRTMSLIFIQQSGSGNNAQLSFMITSPVYFATGITPEQYALALEAQLHPTNALTGSFYAPNSNITLSGFPDVSTQRGGSLFPQPAVPGAAVYDAQLTLYYHLNTHPTQNNMSLWLSQIRRDIAVNAAFLCNVSNVDALLPFISIQSPAANSNPATFVIGSGRQYSLTFTLSAYMTTVTGPYWTPDVLQQGFAYLATYDGDNVVLFQPFSSNITIQQLSGIQVTDIPTATGATGPALQPACQHAPDVQVVIQATFTNATVGGANSDQFIELIQRDIAWMLTLTADADPGTVGYTPGYPTVEAAAFLPYITVVWPFLNTDNPNAPMIQSYSPQIDSGNGVYQPFTNKSAYFFIKFNLLSTAACILDGFTASGIVQELFESPLLVGSPFTTTNAHLQVAVDDQHMPSIQSVQLSNLSLCPSTATPPSCSFVSPLPPSNFTAGTIYFTFALSLGFPIVHMIDFNLKLAADIVLNFHNLGSYQPSALLPYIVIDTVYSSVMDSTAVSFAVLGSVSSLGFSATSLVAGFIQQVELGNVTLPQLAYWYGASALLQAVVIGSPTGSPTGSPPGQGSECALAYDATVRFEATFTNTTTNGTNFIQLIQQDVLQQLAHAATTLSVTAAVNVTLLQYSVSVIWPYVVTDQDNLPQQWLETYAPGLNGSVVTATDPSAPFYVKFELLANATCLLNGLSAVSVAEAFFVGMRSTFVGQSSQLLFSTADVQVQPVVLSGLSLCTGGGGFSCPGRAFSAGDGSSSTGSAPSSSSPYPVGSQAIVFYVVISSISSEGLFAIEIQEDIAVNLANITGVSVELLLPFVLVTSVNGSVIVGAGARRLLQSSPVPISFVLLGSVSTLSTASVAVSASALTRGFVNKAEQGTLQTPNTGASVPAQTVGSAPVGPTSTSASSSSTTTGSAMSASTMSGMSGSESPMSSSTGLQGATGNGAASNSASVYALVVALVAAAALL